MCSRFYGPRARQRIGLNEKCFVRSSEPRRCFEVERPGLTDKSTSTQRSRDASATIAVFRGGKFSGPVPRKHAHAALVDRLRRFVAVCFTLFMCTTLRNFEKGRTLMHTFVAAVGLAALMFGSVFLTSADAARRVAPAYDQPRAQRNSGGSWRCYPYCDGGTYEGRPVREWLKPDRW